MNDYVLKYVYIKMLLVVFVINCLFWILFWGKDLNGYLFELWY